VIFPWNAEYALGSCGGGDIVWLLPQTIGIKKGASVEALAPLDSQVKAR
jgi:hypothetical protein